MACFFVRGGVGDCGLVAQEPSARAGDEAVGTLKAVDPQVAPEERVAGLAAVSARFQEVRALELGSGNHQLMKSSQGSR